MIEARAKGSGWEITSTLTARENERKKKNRDDTKNFKQNFKNAVQSFITFNAFCPPPNDDGVHQLTDKGAKRAPHPSKKMKRIGNEENELDRAALAEIRSMNASRDTKVNTKKRKLGSEGEQEEQEREEQEREKQQEQKEEERHQMLNDSKTPAANERRFFALYGGEDEATAGSNQAGKANKEKEEKKVEITVAVVKEKEECGRKTSPPATKMSYANMRKEAVPGTVQIIAASGKKHIVSATKGWNKVRSDNTSNAVERIEKGPTEQIPTSTRAPDEAVSCGIFSTGSGRAIKFKNIEKSLARGRALLTGTPDISGVAPSSPHDVSRSEFLNARNSKLIESGQLDYQTPMNSSRQREIGGGRGGLGSSIFSTGNGKTMRVSEASLERGRMLLDASDVANKTPVSTTHIGTSALTMSEKRPPGFPLVENKTDVPNSAPSAARFRAAHNHQRQYQNMSRMNPEQHRTSGENAFAPPLGSTRTTLQRQKDSTLNHLPTHDLFKSRIGRQKLSEFFDGALPFSEMGDAPMTDILAANITFDSAQEYRIADIVVNSRNLDVQSLTLGWRDIRDLMFTRGAKEKNLSEEWCANAYRHVVWTAASLKRAFGRKANQALSATHVLERMMYRYEREINQMRRPILRRVLERDSPSTVPMILIVSAIRSFGMCFEEENEEEKYKKLYPAEIEVSDGWYSVRAVLDDVLSSHLRANKIRVGSKMFVQNCQLNGAPEGEGVQPLKSEAYKARLLLHSNSCRPCKWDAKLGLQKFNLTVPLCSVRIDGGDVPRVLLRIDRHFPPVYRERTFAARDDESNVDSAVPAFVTRREESEIRERDKFETLQRRVIERALNKNNAENESQDTSNYEKAVSENRTAHFEKKLHLRQEEVKLRALEEAGIPERRNVSRVCRILAHGLIKHDHRIDTLDSICPKKGFSHAVVTVWDADEAFTSALEEGCVYAATHLKATEGKDEIQLTGTKHTRWMKISSDTIRHAGLHIIEKTSREKSYVDCLAIHLLTGPQFLENGGRRFAKWMFFVEIKNDDGSIIVHPNARAELFAVKISGWDEIELEKNCTRWTNLCEKCDNKCVLLRNITPDDGFDERHLVRKSSASVETFEVLASTTKAKHLASRLDRFQSHYSHETRDFIGFLRDRAMSLVSNSNNNTVAKEPTLSQFTPPRIQFEDEDNTRRRSSIRLSDSEGWGGSQWPRACVEECLQRE